MPERQKISPNPSVERPVSGPAIESRVGHRPTPIIDILQTRCKHMEPRAPMSEPAELRQAIADTINRHRIDPLKLPPRTQRRNLVHMRSKLRKVGRSLSDVCLRHAKFVRICPNFGFARARPEFDRIQALFGRTRCQDRSGFGGFLHHLGRTRSEIERNQHKVGVSGAVLRGETTFAVSNLSGGRHGTSKFGFLSNTVA